jgi:hypothetical protein
MERHGIGCAEKHHECNTDAGVSVQRGMLVVAVEAGTYLAYSRGMIVEKGKWFLA